MSYKGIENNTISKPKARKKVTEPILTPLLRQKKKEVKALVTGQFFTWCTTTKNPEYEEGLKTLPFESCLIHNKCNKKNGEIKPLRIQTKPKYFTHLQRHKLTEEDYRGERFRTFHKDLKGNNDLLSITQPEAVKQVHRLYLQAGADIVETNTFSGTTIGMADYHLEDLVYELNYESAKIAREVADEFTDKPRFVAGSIGPTNRTASMSPDVNDPGFRAVTFDDLRVAYKQQVEALVDGGCDVLLVETIFDTLNAKAALFAIEEVKEERNIDIPVMVSGTITDASGRTLSGQTVEAFLISISHIPLLSIGFNCALGADQLKPYLKRLSMNTQLNISAHPNAGLPNAFGHYDQTPEEMQALIREYLQDNLINIIGGCCGTSPEHIRVIAKLAASYKPRVFTQPILESLQ